MALRKFLNKARKAGVTLTIDQDSTQLMLDQTDFLSGTINLTAHRKVEVKKLTLRFAGVCTVSWQEQEHVGDYDNTKIYSSTIHMFQNVENVIYEEPRQYEMGEYKFQFGFLLPLEKRSWLPSSYNGACGSISYLLESRLNVGGKIDQIVQLPLTVINTLSMINVYTPVLQKQGMVESESFSRSCFCVCPSKEISVKLITNKIGYTIGETVVVTLEFENSSSTTLRAKVRVQEETIYKAECGRTTTTTNTKAKASCTPIQPRNSFDQLRTLKFELTKDLYNPDTTIDKKVISMLWNISVRHHVKVEVERPSIELKLPIIIGIGR